MNNSKFLDTPISEAIEKYPGVEVILISYGLGCVGCAFSGAETILQGAKRHGIMDEDLTMMMKDINTFVSRIKNNKD